MINNSVKSKINAKIYNWKEGKFHVIFKKNELQNQSLDSLLQEYLNDWSILVRQPKNLKDTICLTFGKDLKVKTNPLFV